MHAGIRGDLPGAVSMQMAATDRWMMMRMSAAEVQDATTARLTTYKTTQQAQPACAAAQLCHHVYILFEHLATRTSGSQHIQHKAHCCIQSYLAVLAHIPGESKPTVPSLTVARCILEQYYTSTNNARYYFALHNTTLLCPVLPGST
jgi:hypothetical protein